MHTITLTPYLANRVRLGYVHAAITPDDLSGAHHVSILGDAQHYNARITTVERIGMGAITAHARALNLGREEADIVSFLRAVGYPTTPNTLFSLVRWDRLLADSAPLVSAHTSVRPAEDIHVLEKHPHLSLNRLLAPLATARTNHPVAIGLPYEAGLLPGAAENMTPRDILVLGKGTTGFVAKRLDTLPARYAQTIWEWVRYGVGTNDWNLSLGKDALAHLRAYVPSPTFDCTVFFFQDRAIAVANTPERPMALAGAATDTPPTNHHLLATVQGSTGVLAALSALSTPNTTKTA